MSGMLLQGRIQLFAVRKFTRAKIRTPSNLDIDTAYLDRRRAAVMGNGLDAKGEILVIVCQVPRAFPHLWA